jgi:hypothetical protein
MPSFPCSPRAVSLAPALLFCVAVLAPAARAQLKSGTPMTVPPRPPVKTWVRVPFPEIHDFNSLVIKLSGQAVFFGYDAELHGDGTILFEGSGGVMFPGPHRCSIPAENVRALVEYMREREYFSYDDKYEATNVMDGGIVQTSITFDDKHKSVYDYMGTYMGMPGGVSKIENEIGRVMGVGRWLSGNDDTMRCLQAENFDFRSQEAAEAVDRLKRNRASNTKLLLALAAAGAGSVEEIVLRRALIDAHSKHDPDAARQLLKMANVDMSLLALAADVGIPEFMAEALKIEKDVDKRDWRGLTLLMIAVSRRQSVDQSSDIDRSWTARLLLEAGADANLTDKDGNTPLLLNRYDATVVQYLLQAGAKIDARNNAGETALMRAETPELTRILLLNHADPSLRDAAGETALDIAKREHNDAKIAVLTGQKP